MNTSDLPERLRALAEHITCWDHPITAKQDCLDAAREIKRLRGTLAEALRHWQHGIGCLTNPWRRKMAKILGDEAGLAEPVPCDDDCQHCQTQGGVRVHVRAKTAEMPGKENDDA